MLTCMRALVLATLCHQRRTQKRRFLKRRMLTEDFMVTLSTIIEKGGMLGFKTDVPEVTAYFNDAIEHCGGRYIPVVIPSLVKDGKLLHHPQQQQQQQQQQQLRRCRHSNDPPNTAISTSTSTSTSTDATSTTAGACATECSPSPFEMIEVAMATQTEWQLTAEMKGLSIDAAVYKIR